MKQYNRITISVILSSLVLAACSRTIYTSNGERIYLAGENMSGMQLLDRDKSSITLIKGCKGCHGPSGSRIKSCNIQWSVLTDPAKMKVPYTTQLFYRFLEDDLKSDGTKARTGVHWQMTVAEKDDLIAYLKAL